LRASSNTLFVGLAMLCIGILSYLLTLLSFGGARLRIIDEFSMLRARGVFDESKMEEFVHENSYNNLFEYSAVLASELTNSGYYSVAIALDISTIAVGVILIGAYILACANGRSTPKHRDQG
jgi:hypothetical protein